MLIVSCASRLPSPFPSPKFHRVSVVVGVIFCGCFVPGGTLRRTLLLVFLPGVSWVSPHTSSLPSPKTRRVSIAVGVMFYVSCVWCAPAPIPIPSSSRPHRVSIIGVIFGVFLWSTSPIPVSPSPKSHRFSIVVGVVLGIFFPAGGTLRRWLAFRSPRCALIG